MMKLSLFRKKSIALFCCVVFALQFVSPAISFALTSGPSQPEVQSFQPAGTTEMVDIFSGDFSYNIPLFELPGPNGGYPFNLSYQAGIGMDQEASWVGLGWSLNPGAITRQMRGLPDEFNGDEIKTRMTVKENITVGLGAGAGVELFGGDGSLTGGFSVYHNNYKGLGYSIDGSLGFSKATGGGMTGGIGLDFGLDSQEGVSMRPSLSLGYKVGEVGLGVGYHSKSGLSNLSFMHSINYSLTGKGEKRIEGARGSNNRPRDMASSSAVLSLAHPGYTPQVTMPMKSLNLAAEFKPGGSWWGVFGNIYVRGFYNEQRLDRDNREMTSKGYGYMNYQYAEDPTAVLDLNREKEGLVTKESPNLAIPSLTYDIYSVTGQGISAMYRPMRNDYGVVYDQQMSSVSNGGSIGVDVGPAANHVGVNLSVNHATSTSGRWSENNDLTALKGSFQSKRKGSLFEPWYLKVHGEPSVETENAIGAIGGDKAVRVSFDGNSSSNPKALAAIENRTWGKHDHPDNNALSENRKSRNQSIQPLTNKELLKDGSQEVLPHFRISYLNENDAVESNYNRQDLPAHHIAGYTTVTPEGLRYHYALPAYNNKHEEVTFSAEGSIDPVSPSVSVVNTGDGDPKYKHEIESDEFLKSVQIPKYAHAHLLTSIIGPDYVDLASDGVTPDDLGYWVKFTYRRVSDDFKWRDPFSGAHYQQGWKSDPRDDKGNFVYGEKELWYLARAETKTHIADFSISSDRHDAKGVAWKLQDTNGTGASAFKLTDIKLYTRLSGSETPIKIVRFDYDASLCKGFYEPLTSGKLTLKKVWFEYGGTAKGQLNPYQFDYDGLNPDYDKYAYDRWGNYKPRSNAFDNVDFPYVSQNPVDKSQLDQYAAAWSLKEIRTPSGAKIIIDYETDDYGFVQHKQAMQMMQVVNPQDLSDNGEIILADDQVKIMFKLETEVDGNASEELQRKEVLKYLDTERMLYFKLRINLRKAGENFFENISGYATIDQNAEMKLARVGSSGNYTHGYFHLVKETGNQGHTHHPFSMRAWQHLRTNQPEITNLPEMNSAGVEVEQTDDPGQRVDQIKSLVSIGPEVRQMFEGFYDYCSGQHFGRQLKLNKSWVRLKSPDKRKYGGGHRVRQITINDNWNDDHEGVYGQVYEYTTIDPEGNEISSGVASYEPIVGGDENALRYAKEYVQSVPLRADNQLFFEYPINESYYPGSQVGYSKVTVWSLASAYRAGKLVENLGLPESRTLFPQNPAGGSFGTTGKTVHEFYTAKDFPVITDETEKANDPYRLFIPVPLLGSLSISKLAASQGYSIVTNNMHGKQKAVSNFRQDNTGAVEPSPISWIKYNYHSQQKIYDRERVNVLLNSMREGEDKSLQLPTPANANLPAVIFGQETEFFSDMRQYEDKTWTGGARYNTEVLYIPVGPAIVPVPVPTIWPSIAKTENLLRTSVTNKIIFKTGILVSTEAYDGGSTIITRNEKWDKLSGVPILTKTNNNFDDPVYSYSILGHTQYAGMGAASKNVGLTFSISSVVEDPYKDRHYDFHTTLQEGYLFPGDEIILYKEAEGGDKPVAKAIYLGATDGDKILFADGDLTGQKFNAMIVRSGFRNHLTATVGTQTGLQDPSIKGPVKYYNKTITVIE